MVEIYIGSTYGLQVFAPGERRKDKVGEKILAKSTIFPLSEQPCSPKPLTRVLLKQGNLESILICKELFLPVKLGIN